MREVNKKVIDVRNPTHIVLKVDEISADDINNLSDSDNPSVLQIASQTELPNEEEQQGEEVKVERTTGEDIPERKDMGRATSMDGKSNWSKSGKNYEFDATLKKTRNQLDMLKAPTLSEARQSVTDAQSQTALDTNEGGIEVYRQRPEFALRVDKFIEEEGIDKKMEDAANVGKEFVKLDTHDIGLLKNKFRVPNNEQAIDMIKDHYKKKGFKDGHFTQTQNSLTISWTKTPMEEEATAVEELAQRGPEHDPTQPTDFDFNL